ncbi:hypothetical protein BHE97_15345 [Aeromicrobium sp. PE09-221]|uniref:hypothetical protein n=1 Tax=Aeromicrobium sp. PE09-221 TaxID=1898043 RepID=UPI000B3EA94C|nr:hypothetical protein [Aeromicrobium sp. PE09-221]OUZ07761.1 hypothetical protein BHE97_15345 [Aeromicrobium sp. PE09-221]
MRYGPLHAVPDGLVIGKIGGGGRSRRGEILGDCALLTPEAIVHRRGVEEMRIFGWNQLGSAVLRLPTTDFRFPRLRHVLGVTALGVLGDDAGLVPDDGFLDLRTTEEAYPLRITRHHTGGYWRPIVVSAQRLLDDLIEHPDQREFLADPPRAIEIVAARARRRRR